MDRTPKIGINANLIGDYLQELKITRDRAEAAEKAAIEQNHRAEKAETERDFYRELIEAAIKVLREAQIQYGQKP